MHDFVNAYIATDKADRSANSPPNERNEKVNNAYYDLYSYVRIEPNYPVFYEMLFRKGRKKRSRIVKFLNKLLGMLEGDDSKPLPEEQSQDTTSSILYVHKGTIICQRDLHNIVPATAVLAWKTARNTTKHSNFCNRL